MSGAVHVALDRDPPLYRAGDAVRASIRVEPAGTLEPRAAFWQLVWFTEGAGDEDVGVVRLGPLALPPLLDMPTAVRIEARLPDGPWSYAGRLVKIRWAVQVKVELGRKRLLTANAPLVLLPPGDAREREAPPTR